MSAREMDLRYSRRAVLSQTRLYWLTKASGEIVPGFYRPMTQDFAFIDGGRTNFGLASDFAKVEQA